MTSPFPSRKKPKILQLLFFSFIVLFLASTSAILGAVTALLAPEKFDFTEPESNILDGLWQHRFKYSLSRPVNILVLGIDGSPHSSTSSPDLFKGRVIRFYLSIFNLKINQLVCYPSPEILKSKFQVMVQEKLMKLIIGAALN